MSARYAIQIDSPRAAETGCYPTVWLYSVRTGQITTEQHRAQTWAQRETAERHAERVQASHDAQDRNRYGSQVGDSLVTVVEVRAS